MPDAPDIVLCSKLCRHNPTDPKLQRVKAAYCTCKTQVYMSMAPSTLIRFQTKTELFCSGYGYRPHYNAENDHKKTEPFENALQSGAIWKRCFLKALFSSVEGENDAVWKRWRHQNRHDRAPDHSTVNIQNGGQTLPCGFNFAGRYIEMRMRRVHFGIKAFSKRIRRCRVDGRKRCQNDKCGRKSFWKRSKTAPFSYENGLVWTGPESSKLPCCILI